MDWVLGLAVQLGRDGGGGRVPWTSVGPLSAGLVSSVFDSASSAERDALSLSDLRACPFGPAGVDVSGESLGFTAVAVPISGSPPSSSRI